HRAPQHLERATVLQRQARGHGRIARVGQKDFSRPSIGEIRGARRVAQAVELDLEYDRGAAIRETFAGGHGAALRKNGGMMSNGLSHEIRSTVVGPVWLRSQTNHAKAMPLLALRPSQPARCIIGSRLRKQWIRASPQPSRMFERRSDS